MPGPRGRRNQADIEVVAETVWSETTVNGLLDEWIVPRIVDHIIEEMGLSQAGCKSAIIMHTISHEEIADGESNEAGEAPEARPPEKDVPAPTAAHGDRAQGAEQVRGGKADDGQ